MRVFRRPLAPGEIDHEAVWLAVTIGAAVLALLWSAVGIPWPQCIFHHFTGEPCLTCGATRAAVALAHGNFANALRFNPLATVALLAVIAFNFYAATALVLHTRRFRFLISSRSKSILRVAVLIIVAANWIYLIERGLV